LTMRTSAPLRNSSPRERTGSRRGPPPSSIVRSTSFVLYARSEAPYQRLDRGGGGVRVVLRSEDHQFDTVAVNSVRAVARGVHTTIVGMTPSLRSAVVLTTSRWDPLLE
jgi:hypothetical protein